MSIAATITDVVYHDDGTCDLILSGEDRGQNRLKVLNPNPHLRALIGEKIHAGGEGAIMLARKGREVRIGTRVGYTRMRLDEVHLTDSEACWCNPTVRDGVVVHRTEGQRG